MSRIIKSKKQAEEEAAKLVKELGNGWKPRVWENTGWNYCANLKVGDMGFAVHGPTYERDLNRKDQYSCYASCNHFGGHSANFGDVPYGETPSEAFSKCIRKIKKHLNKVEALYELGKSHEISIRA